MAGKQISGDGLASNLAGMSKNQLYDIMCQMKTLIEQNQQQARQILIQNPLLTRALFQAQIMLGMVKPPQAVPNIQPQASQPPPQPVQQTKAHVVNSTPSLPGLPDQENVAQAQVPVRKQPQNQSLLPPISSTSLQGNHSQSILPKPVEQPRSYLNTQATQMPHPQSSQMTNLPSLPHHSGSQPPSSHQPPLPPLPGHLQQPSGISHHPLQPPLPMQSRPPIPLHFQPPMGSNVNFQNAGIPHMQQPMFHPSSRPLGGMGLSFPPGQLPPPNQPPHQPLYQGGGSHLGTDFGNQGGNPAQMDRGSPWPPVSRENSAGSQLIGPPPLGLGLGPGPGQTPFGNQALRPPPLTPEVEQALLQQVMSLTPEQINLLPPDQRHQVLQLQQMLRQ